MMDIFVPAIGAFIVVMLMFVGIGYMADHSPPMTQKQARIDSGKIWVDKLLSTGGSIQGCLNVGDYAKLDDVK